MFILSLSTLPATIIVFATFTLASVVPFVIIRRLFPGKVSPETVTSAQWLALRIGAVHALILALIFAEVRQEYNELAETIDQEAASIVQLHRALNSIGGNDAAEIQKQLIDYTRTVISKEWPSLAQGQPSREADALIDQILLRLSKFQTSAENLASSQRLLEWAVEIERMRAQRSFDIAEPLPAIFWVIGILGFIVTVIIFYVFEPTLFNCIGLSFYAGLIGIVLYSILALTHPFMGGAAIGPDALEAVYQRQMQN